MNTEVVVDKDFPSVFHHSYQIIYHTYMLKLIYILLTLMEEFHSKYLQAHKGEDTITFHNKCYNTYS